MWMISMKAVLDIVSQYCPDDDGSCSKAGVDLREMLDEIEGLDETEVVPVRRGQWINNTYTQVFPWKCEKCNYDSPARFNWCPNCGSRMVGESE